MFTLHFTIPGYPVATARAGRKFNPKTGKANSFTPKKTRIFQNLVRMAFTAAYPEFIPQPGPILMRAKIYQPIVGTLRKAEREMAERDENAVPQLKKPDGKNVRWGIEDALEGVAFNNDSQVFDYADRKTYSSRPRIEVWMTIYPEGTTFSMVPR